MTVTYDDSEASDLHKVRGIIGDTITDDAYLQDETITALLTVHGSVLATSVECCRRILARIARDTDRNAVGFSASRSQVTQHYRDLMADLSAQLTATATCFVGGTSLSEEQDLESDDDFIEPSFKIGDNDNSTPRRFDRTRYDD